MGYQKDLVSVEASPSKVRAHVVLAYSLLLAIACTGRAICQADSGAMAEKLKANVVRIVSGQEHGFGFVVAEQQGFVYVVTARHVIARGADDPSAPPVRQVSVTFYTDQGKSVDGEVLGTHKNDLAVVRVRVPAGFGWVRACIASQDKQHRGTQVSFVGRRDEWYVPGEAGVIASPNPSTDSLIEVDGLPVSHGTSGAPLIANTGIVGMIQEDSGDDTRVLTIDYIRRAFEEWNHPWHAQAADIFPACLSGKWKEQYDNPAIWNFTIRGEALYIERFDSFVSGSFAKEGNTYIGDLHWGNGDVWKNVVLTPDADCSQVKTNQSWWYHR